MQMNKNQLQAVQTVEGQLVIVACPGSGKTTTLLNRIYYMTEELGIDPSSILMVTFSKAAADEMKERYKKCYSKDSSVYFGTIHAFCLALIKKFSPQRFKSGVISDFDVMDFFMKRLRNSQNIGNKADFIADLRRDIGVFKNTNVSLKEFVPICCKSKDTFNRLYNAYEQLLKDVDRIDFDDMLLIAYEILCQDDQALSWVQNRYRYILVDEYQDINEIQRDIIYKITGDNGNLAVVGDDDQAIYGFRGAKSSIMLNFQKDYPQSKVIHLEVNYRSNSEIVDRAASLIENNVQRFDKEFQSDRGQGGKVRYVISNTREEQISTLVDSIKKVIGSGIPSNEIAVIYRVNKQGTMIAKTLFDSKIDFRTNDKITGIYDHWIYSDIQAFYRMSIGKGSQYDFVQTLNHPNRYLYDDDIKKNGPDRAYMVRTIRQKGYEEWKEISAIENVGVYFALLDSIRKAVTPGDVVRALIKDGKYETYLSEYAEYRNEDVSELKMVLSELHRAAKTCNTWEEWNQLAQKEKADLENATKGQSGVTLTTMHSAKGLEWDVVYIIDCVEGKCPYIKASAASDLEEERRLFYVAMTRAKSHLALMRSENDGSSRLSESRFLREAGIASDRVTRIKKDSGYASASARNKKSKLNHEKFKSAHKKDLKYSSRSTYDASVPSISVGDQVDALMYGEGEITSIKRESGVIKKFTVHYVVDGDRDYLYPDAFKKGMRKK